MGEAQQTPGAVRPRAARRLALAVTVLVLGACVPTGERPTLQAVDTSTSETVLGEVIERSTTTTSDDTTTSSTDESTTTTAAFVTTTTRFFATTTVAAPTTTTTRPPTTTTTKPKPGVVAGSFDGTAGTYIDVFLRTSGGSPVAARDSVLVGEGPTGFTFGNVTPGRYRIVITDTGGTPIVSSAVFELGSAGSARVDCTPSACDVAL